MIPLLLQLVWNVASMCQSGSQNARLIPCLALELVNYSNFIAVFRFTVRTDDAELRRNSRTLNLFRSLFHTSDKCIGSVLLGNL